LYYCEQYKVVKQFVLDMESESQAMHRAKQLFQDNDISEQLALIKGNIPIHSTCPLHYLAGEEDAPD